MKIHKPEFQEKLATFSKHNNNIIAKVGTNHNPITEITITSNSKNFNNFSFLSAVVREIMKFSLPHERPEISKSPNSVTLSYIHAHKSYILHHSNNQSQITAISCHQSTQITPDQLTDKILKLLENEENFEGGGIQ